LPLGATGLACIVRRGGEVSFLSGWMTVGPPWSAASAGRAPSLPSPNEGGKEMACPTRRDSATIGSRIRNLRSLGSAGGGVNGQAHTQNWATIPSLERLPCPVMPVREAISVVWEW
jgi:hypothetical protein